MLYLETPRPHGPYGASGCGEAPLTSPHTAIINAIHDACGARVRHLPALPEKVLAAMKDGHPGLLRVVSDAPAAVRRPARRAAGAGHDPAPAD